MTEPAKHDRSQVVLGYLGLIGFIAYAVTWPWASIVHWFGHSIGLIAIGAVVIPAGVLLFLFSILSIPRSRGGR